LTLRNAILEQEGYAVLTAETCAAALKLFRHNPVDLVIADHMLKGESGSDLAARIKRLKPDVPVVMLSGSPPETMNNVDCFIEKGEPTSHILAIVRDLMQRSCG
jgi:DNA-binding response OmpR family regulator